MSVSVFEKPTVQNGTQKNFSIFGFYFNQLNKVSKVLS